MTYVRDVKDGGKYDWEVYRLDFFILRKCFQHKQTHLDSLTMPY